MAVFACRGKTGKEMQLICLTRIYKRCLYLLSFCFRWFKSPNLPTSTSTNPIDCARQQIYWLWRWFRSPTLSSLCTNHHRNLSGEHNPSVSSCVSNLTHPPRRQPTLITHDLHCLYVHHYTMHDLNSHWWNPAVPFQHPRYINWSLTSIAFISSMEVLLLLFFF